MKEAKVIENNKKIRIISKETKNTVIFPKIDLDKLKKFKETEV